MNSNTKNFSLVSYLTGGEYEKVHELQKKLSEITGSKKALEDWLPHITLGDGVVVPEKEFPNLKTGLSDICRSQNAITINVNGFGGTENWVGAVENKITPYVIWLNVEASSELLQLFNNLKEKITSQYDAWLPRIANYVPHITLAFADLSEEGYKKGMRYLPSQTLQLSLTISHIALVECYGEGNMKSREYERFYFKK